MKILGCIEIECVMCGMVCRPKIAGLQTLQVRSGQLVIINHQEHERVVGWLCDHHKDQVDKQVVRFSSNRGTDGEAMTSG